MSYIPCRYADGTWYALLTDNETEIGPYPSLEELERDMEKIQRHLESKCFAGAK